MKSTHPSFNKLLPCQKRAFNYIERYAKENAPDARKKIDEILLMSDIDSNTYDDISRTLVDNAKVAVHFHPDRPTNNLKTIVQNLLDQGIYKNQFETHISAGGLSAFKGGDRYKWEKILFNGAYNKIGVKDSYRPKYGSLLLINSSDGPSPRFGSCYFILTSEVTKRSTFTYLGSQDNPKEKGTIEYFDYVFFAILSDVFFHEHAFGQKDLTVRKLFDQILDHLEKPFSDLAHFQPSRNLDYFVEAQIHGTISLSEDVETLVADSCFIGSSYESLFNEISKKYSIKLLWSPGFSMRIEDVPTNFRGTTMPSLAKKIAENGMINTRIIGNGVNSLHAKPDLWLERGSYSAVLQEFKLLWHVLVKYGYKYIDNL